MHTAFFCIVSYLIFTTVLWGRQFIDEEMGNREGMETCRGQHRIPESTQDTESADLDLNLVSVHFVPVGDALAIYNHTY